MIPATVPTIKRVIFLRCLSLWEVMRISGSAAQRQYSWVWRESRAFFYYYSNQSILTVSTINMACSGLCHWIFPLGVVELVCIQSQTTVSLTQTLGLAKAAWGHWSHEEPSKLHPSTKENNLFPSSQEKRVRFQAATGPTLMGWPNALIRNSSGQYYHGV